MTDFVLSIIAGFAVSLLAMAGRTLREWIEARRKLKEAEEARFQAALAADSLIELGGYLDGPIGSFLVNEYAHNPTVRERVNTFLARLEQYVGRPEEMVQQTEAPALADYGFGRAADTELDGVERRLQEGRPWDALAALRRTIERRLLAMARQHDVPVPEKPGAGRLLQLLRRRQVLAEDVTASLQYAIDVANRGVHGLDVGEDEAYEALRHATRALSSIELNRQ